jgi:O-antigen/teichoic acid export membrane protein
MLVTGVAAYGTLLDLGISSAVIKHTAEHVSHDNWGTARAISGTALRLYSALAVVGIAASALLAATFPSILSLSPPDEANARQLVFVVGCSFALALPCTLASSVLRGMQRFDVLNIMNAGVAILSALATVVILAAGGRVLALALLNLVLIVLLHCIAMWTIRRIAPSATPAWRYGTWSQSRAIFRFSGAVIIVSIAGRLQTKSDEVLVGTLGTFSAVTPYNLARRLSEFPQVIADQFLKILLPIASGMHSRQQAQDLHKLLIVGTRITLALFIPVGYTVAYLSEAIISVWVGDQFAYAWPVAVVLTLASGFSTITWPAGTVLQAMSRHSPLAVSAVVTASANVAISILLLGRYGIIGVAIGTLVPTLLETSCFVFPYALRTIGVGTGAFFKGAFAPVLIPTAIMSFLMWLARRSVAPQNAIELFLLAACGVTSFGLAYCFTGRHTPEVKYIVDRLLGRWQQRRSKTRKPFSATSGTSN